MIWQPFNLNLRVATEDSELKIFLRPKISFVIKALNQNLCSSKL